MESPKIQAKTNKGVNPNSVKFPWFFGSLPVKSLINITFQTFKPSQLITIILSSPNLKFLGTKNPPKLPNPNWVKEWFQIIPVKFWLLKNNNPRNPNPNSFWLPRAFKCTFTTLYKNQSSSRERLKTQQSQLSYPLH